MSDGVKLWLWAKRHIDIRYVFTLFATTNIVYREGGQIGYSDVYICGIRIARLQKTKPWD